MWDGADTVGLISCIAGTILLFVPLPNLITTYIVLFGGGGATLAMGIVAVAKTSKIGIGGIILGALILFIGILYMLFLV